MPSRLFQVMLTLAGVMLSASLLAAEKQPNVLFILSDDQAYTDYGFMGHQQIQTPHLDKLAKQSLVYTHGYVPTSLCRASLMTLVTGKYPHEHGITGNDPPKGTPRAEMLRFVRESPTLPRLLAKAGYRTFQCGKWWEGSYADGGFTQGMSHGDVTRGGRHGDVGLKIGREGLQPIYDFIEESKETPWFVWYAPMLPHQPHNPPERLLKKYRDKVKSLHVAKYYAMCEWWDETCGELLAYLDKQQLSENTLVVYVCDNGWIQQPEKATFDPRSKRSPYEPGIRTPMMFRWPGKIEPAVNHTPQSTVLMMPTILSECGISADMKNASSLTRSPVSGPVFGEIYEHDVVEIGAPAKSLQFRWCRDGDWKLIVPARGAEVELYNLKDDPQESKNVATSNAKAVDKLQRLLDAWWKP